MKIGIDIQTTLGQKTGFGFYVQSLVKNLKKYDLKNQYFLFQPREKNRDLSTPQRFLWDQFGVPGQARKMGVDILHQPCFSAPIFYHGKTVVTVHDLIAIVFGKDIPFFSRQYFGRWMPFTYRKADHIIAISQHTKKDLERLLKIPSSKISVIYLAAGINSTKVEKEKIEKIKQKYEIKKDYLLHVGTINPRKNLEFLIKVFAKVRTKFPNLQLVISGKKGWYYEGLFNLVEKLGLKNKVLFTDYISDSELPYLYAGAKIFVFPSLYEGFGLPPLEAIQSGTPVISSNTSSMPEVVGKAGILLPPNDERLWVEKITQLLQNRNLQQELIAKGKKQAAKFSWEKTAQQTVEIYEKINKNLENGRAD